MKDKLRVSRYILCPMCQHIALTDKEIRPTDWYMLGHFLHIQCTHCNYVFKENMTKHFSRVPELTEEQIIECIGTEGYYASMADALEEMPPFSHFGIKIDGRDNPDFRWKINVAPYRWSVKDEAGYITRIGVSPKTALDANTGKPINWDHKVLYESGGRYDCDGAEKEFETAWNRWKKNKCRGLPWMYEPSMNPEYLKFWLLQHPEAKAKDWDGHLIIWEWLIEKPKESPKPRKYAEAEGEPTPMLMFEPCKVCGVQPLNNQLTEDDHGWHMTCPCGRSSPYMSNMLEIRKWWTEEEVRVGTKCPMCPNLDATFISNARKNGQPAKVWLCKSCGYRWIQ